MPGTAATLCYVSWEDQVNCIELTHWQGSGEEALVRQGSWLLALRGTVFRGLELGGS